MPRTLPKPEKPGLKAQAIYHQPLLSAIENRR